MHREDWLWSSLFFRTLLSEFQGKVLVAWDIPGLARKSQEWNVLCLKASANAATCLLGCFTKKAYFCKESIGVAHHLLFLTTSPALKTERKKIPCYRWTGVEAWYGTTQRNVISYCARFMWPLLDFKSLFDYKTNLYFPRQSWNSYRFLSSAASLNLQGRKTCENGGGLAWLVTKPQNNTLMCYVPNA